MTSNISVHVIAAGAAKRDPERSKYHMKRIIIASTACLLLGGAAGSIVTFFACSGSPEMTIVTSFHGIDYKTPLWVLSMALSDTKLFIGQLEREDGLPTIVWKVDPQTIGYTYEVESANLGDIPTRISTHFQNALAKYQEQYDKIGEASNKTNEAIASSAAEPAQPHR